jgi:hypothetical protein
MAPTAQAKLNNLTEKATGIENDVNNEVTEISNKVTDMPSVQPYVKKAQDIISNIEGAFNVSNLNSSSTCEKFEIAAIVYHFSNFLLNYDNFETVGYDLGAISYDLVDMITGDCFDRVIDDVEDAVGDVIGWFEGFLRRRRLGAGSYEYTPMDYT